MTAILSRQVHETTDSVIEHDFSRSMPFRDEVSSMDVALPSQAIEGAARKVERWGGRVDSRLALLGIVLAALDDVPFEDAARLLKVKPARLEGMIHGTVSIPAKFDDEGWVIAEILRLLHSVLRPSATGRWLHTPIPALGGLTPLNAVAKGKQREVLRVVSGYREQSFT